MFLVQTIIINDMWWKYYTIVFKDYNTKDDGYWLITLIVSIIIIIIDYRSIVILSEKSRYIIDYIMLLLL